MPIPRPDTSVTARAVETPEVKISCANWSSLTVSSDASSKPLLIAFSRSAVKSSPLPSSLNSNTTSLLSWRKLRRISPSASLPLLMRNCSSSRPCASALRNRCSNGAAILSSTLRSNSTPVPISSRLARLFKSLAVCRTIRYRRSLMLPNGTMRTCIRFSCKSRFKRACANIADEVSSMFFNSECCTVCTSCTLSFMKRVNSCKRVKRSNSSGSNCSLLSLANEIRACIWLSA